MRKSDPRPSSERLTTLLHLVRLGAGASFAGVSTKVLGDSIGLSQQAASLRLIELEKAGLVQRAQSGRGLSVRLTDSGLNTVEGFLAEANAGLKKGKDELTFRGTLFTGFGEGGYYVSLKGYARPFVEALGFEPYPGTLNLRLSTQAMIEQRRRLDSLPGVEVAGFRDGKRTYGPVKCFRASVAGRYQGAVLAIERTHYDSSVVEIISPQNLRKALRLSDGDQAEATVFLS